MIKEEQKIKVEEGDSFEFIEIVNAIISNIVFQYSIKEVVLVKVKNWFDHKWLNYSGKSVIPFEYGGLLNIEKVRFKVNGERRFLFHLSTQIVSYHLNSSLNRIPAIRRFKRKSTHTELVTKTFIIGLKITHPMG